MFRLSLRTLRFRKGGFIATFIAMFFGTAIVMACGGLMESGIRTDVTPQRLAGAAVVLTGETSWELPKQNPADEEEDTESATLPERVPLDDDLVGRVAAVPGVAAAIGDVSFPVTVLGAGGPLSGPGALGHGWDSAELMPYRLTGGGEPGRGEVVLDEAMARDAGASVGDEITVAAHGVSASYRVAGVATPTVSSARQAMFYAGEDVTGLVAHPGAVDSIGVLAEPGADVGALRQQITDALRGEPVVTLVGEERGMAEFPEAERSQENVIVIAAVFGGLAIMVAMFVVASTLGLSVQHREREMALMRAIGTTPGQLRRMVLGEAMVVSVLATALAMLPGSLLGEWLFEQLAENGVVPAVVRFHQGWIPVVVAAGAALLTALGASFVAARRAASARPTEALVEASVQRRWLTPFRLVGALLCFGGGIALAIVTMTVMTGPIAASTAGPSVMLWAIGLAFIAPGITKLTTIVLAGPIRAFGLAGWLATRNARARAVRMAAAVTPIMLATGIATANIYLQTTQADAAEKAFTENLRADVVLSSSTGGLAPEVLGAVRSVPGVAGASEFATTTGFVERPYDDGQAEEGSPVQGVTADSVAATTAVSVTAGRLEDLTGDTVALPSEQAERIGRGVGDTITMRMGDRSQVDVRVVALFTARPGFELVLMPASLVTAHTTSGLPAQILVRAAPGTDVGELTSSLGERTREWPGVGVADRGVLTANFAQDQKTGAWVNYLMVGMIITYTAISVVNTLVMGTGRRRREFGLQRLTGATRGQVLRMMTVEAGLVAGIGVVLGSIVSLTTLVPFSIVVSDTVVPSGPLWIYLAIVGTVGVLTLVSTLLPARAAMRSRPAEAVANPE